MTNEIPNGRSTDSTQLCGFAYSDCSVIDYSLVCHGGRTKSGFREVQGFQASFHTE